MGVFFVVVLFFIIEHFGNVTDLPYHPFLFSLERSSRSRRSGWGIRGGPHYRFRNGVKVGGHYRHRNREVGIRVSYRFGKKR